MFIGAALLALTPASAAAAKPNLPKLVKLSIHSSFAGNEPITVRWKTDPRCPPSSGSCCGPALTGCAPDGPAPAITAILLKADPDATGPTAAFHVSGNIDGVHLAGGEVASVSLDVDLSGPVPSFPAEF